MFSQASNIFCNNIISTSSISSLSYLEMMSTEEFVEAGSSNFKNENNNMDV